MGSDILPMKTQPVVEGRRWRRNFLFKNTVSPSTEKTMIHGSDKNRMKLGWDRWQASVNDKIKHVGREVMILHQTSPQHYTGSLFPVPVGYFYHPTSCP